MLTLTVGDSDGEILEDCCLYHNRLSGHHGNCSCLLNLGWRGLKERETGVENITIVGGPAKCQQYKISWCQYFHAVLMYVVTEDLKQRNNYIYCDVATCAYCFRISAHLPSAILCTRTELGCINSSGPDSAIVSVRETTRPTASRHMFSCDNAPETWLVLSASPHLHERGGFGEQTIQLLQLCNVADSLIKKFPLCQLSY